MTALLDSMMLITGLPDSGSFDEISLEAPGWLGLLAATDTVRTIQMEQLLARTTNHEPTFGSAALAGSIDVALRTNDSRWALGAMALVDRTALADGDGQPGELMTSLVDHALAAPEGGAYRLTESGNAWTEALSTAVRVSHVRILHVIEGSPSDIVGLTYFRSPAAVLSAQTTSAGVLLRRSDSEVAVAALRAALAAADDDAAVTAAPSAASADMSPPAEWVYVLEPVGVRGLYDTAAIVGTLQPGTWYVLERVSEAWAHITNADETIEGWAPAAHIHRETQSPSPEAAPLGAPVWDADHTVPAEGLRTWATPDPASDVVAELAAGVELQVVERRADWARVRASNGWEAWTDGRRLVPIDTRR